MQVRELHIPCTPDFSFASFLAKPTAVRDWNIQGLPSDAFSTENGVIVTKSNRWPLMVDPQGQAIKWIKNMEKHRVSPCDHSKLINAIAQQLFLSAQAHNMVQGPHATNRCTVKFSLQNLKIIDLQMPDFLRTLENSVQFGTPVLLQNIQEELDPSLGPILNKSLIKQGRK